MAGKQENASTWWRREGVSLSGGWHPLNSRIRCSEVPDNEEELYEWEHSEERILLLKGYGVNLVVGQFNRGLGPTDEAEEQDLARRFAGLCHRHGMRHGVYLANTIYFESMLKDHPDCEDWAVHTHDRRLVHYGGEQTWRWVACFNSPGWRDYIRAELERAIKFVKTDVLHFDNLVVWPEPDSCHCPHCREAFRAFLAARYPSPQEQKARFGFPLVETARPPNFYLRFSKPWDLDRIRNPLMQEWIDFRCHTVTAYLREMRDFARRLRPDIAIMTNGQLIWGANQALIHGVNSTAQAMLADICWDENPDLRPDPDPDAIPRSTVRMRGMNLMRRLGREVITGYRDEESLAFNLTFSGNPGINTQWGYSEPRQSLRSGAQPGVEPLLDLFNHHKDLYDELRPLARIAIWRNQRSLAYVSFDTHLSACVMEHVLFTRRIPFSIVQDEFITPDALKAFDVVILPDVEYITDEQVSVLSDFVQAGGSLLITERSGTIGGRGRRRSTPAFAALFASDAAPRSAETAETGSFDPHRQTVLVTGPKAPSATACCGGGRAAYLPALRYKYAPRTFKSAHNVHYDAIDSRYWKDPWNVDEMLSLVQWLKPEYIPIKVFGHPEVRLDWVRFRDGREGCLLMRAGDIAGPEDLRLALRSEAAPVDAELWQPGRADPHPLDWTPRGPFQETLLPRVERHAVVRYTDRVTPLTIKVSV